MRQAKGWFLDAGKKLAASGDKETATEIFASKASKKKCKELGIGTEPLKLRFVRIELETGEIEVLVTNILEGIEHVEFVDLYHKRWFVEESYKQMKSRVEIENFTGKSPLAVRQDFYAKIFTGNLTAILSFSVHDKISELIKNRKRKYQLNFTQALGKMKNTVVLLFVRPMENVKQYINQLWDLFLANIEMVRPNRKKST